ncbi:hypothetical protein B0H13DRAFT_1899415 [Mycena leptocephala]|nr:hypothetical protein B0H13DRAFT_1899415 [Mycena leptocephala]
MCLEPGQYPARLSRWTQLECPHDWKLATIWVCMTISFVPDRRRVPGTRQTPDDAGIGPVIDPESLLHFHSPAKGYTITDSQAGIRLVPAGVTRVSDSKIDTKGREATLKSVHIIKLVQHKAWNDRVWIREQGARRLNPYLDSTETKNELNWEAARFRLAVGALGDRQEARGSEKIDHPLPGRVLSTWVDGHRDRYRQLCLCLSVGGASGWPWGSQRLKNGGERIPVGPGREERGDETSSKSEKAER